MSRELIVRSAGPGVTIQDQGRPGYLAVGLSRGGAMDRLALAEGAALLRQSDNCAAVEMAGFGGEFEASETTMIALTGAPMRTTIDGDAAAWNTTHLLEKGVRLSIGGAMQGSYGYLHVRGGLAAALQLGAQSAHLVAGLGHALKAGDRVALGDGTGTVEPAMTLPVADRFQGGTVRIVPSLQTDVFDRAEIARFEQSVFKRDARGNRMGVRLLPPGEGFKAEAGLSILSEVIVPGDVQITGDGTPFVLMSECQTTGGYPRIGSVLPSDLPIIAQAQPGASLTFRFVSLDEAVAIERKEKDRRAGLRASIRPLIRDPHQMHDLLSYQLISGVIAGNEFEKEEP